jgi:hypothetical protein
MTYRAEVAEYVKLTNLFLVSNKSKKFIAHVSAPTPCHSEYSLHRDHNIQIERANMPCQGIACTKSFYVGLTTAEC